MVNRVGTHKITNKAKKLICWRLGQFSLTSTAGSSATWSKSATTQPWSFSIWCLKTSVASGRRVFNTDVMLFLRYICYITSGKVEIKTISSKMVYIWYICIFVFANQPFCIRQDCFPFLELSIVHYWPRYKHFNLIIPYRVYSVFAFSYIIVLVNFLSHLLYHES